MLSVNMMSVNVCLQAQAFTTSYSDVGLFGVQAVASHFDIGKVCILFVFDNIHNIKANL